MRLRGTAWARAARGLPPSTKKCSWVQWEVSEEEGPSALAPSGRRSPDPSSPLAAGFTGGFVGTPADMVNVRSVLLAPLALLGRAVCCRLAAGALGCCPCAWLLSCPSPPVVPGPVLVGICVSGRPNAAPALQQGPRGAGLGQVSRPLGQRHCGTSAGPPPTALSWGLPPCPVSPPRSPPCSALQDAERRQAAGPPAAKVSGVRALGSGGCGGAAGRQRCTSSGRELWEPAGWGELWESPTLTPSPLTPCSYSHALDGMYRVLREGEAVPAGGEPARGLLHQQERPRAHGSVGAHSVWGGKGPEGGSGAGEPRLCRASIPPTSGAGREEVAACRELLGQSTELEQVGGVNGRGRRRCAGGGSSLGGPGYSLLQHTTALNA